MANETKTINMRADDINAALIGGLSTKRCIKLLCIGNSFTYNAINYMPYILREQYPNLDIVIGIVYTSGQSLEGHYNAMVSGGACEWYSRYNKDTDKWEKRTNVNYTTILTEGWSHITIQQASGKQTQEDTYYPFVAQIVDYIATHTDNKFEAGLLMPQSRADQSKTSKELLEESIAIHQRLCKSINLSFLLPSGTAIENARESSIAALGDSGSLTKDGYHLQDGLPCLIASYACAKAFAKHLGLDFGIVGSKIMPNDDWIAEKNIEGTHLPSVGVTDDNVLLAQKCATLAVENPYEVLAPYEYSKPEPTEDWEDITDKLVQGGISSKKWYGDPRNTSVGAPFVTAIEDVTHLLVNSQDVQYFIPSGYQIRAFAINGDNVTMSVVEPTSTNSYATGSIVGSSLVQKVGSWARATTYDTTETEGWISAKNLYENINDAEVTKETYPTIGVTLRKMNGSSAVTQLTPATAIADGVKVRRKNF